MIDLAEAYRQRALSNEALAREEAEELRRTPPERTIRIFEGLLVVGFDHIRRAYEEVAFQRTRKFTIVGCDFSVASAEDLILSKLAWWRPQDQQDVFSVLSRQRGNLNLEYSRNWAADLGRSLAKPELAGRLEEALAHPDSNR
ncbi:MAG: hypothetical protein HYY93_10840 [Planctomycetes bacterium]|nr:hypothetical protein [Planctomycetota bacterium]